LVHLLASMSTPFEWHCAHHACAQIICIAFTHSSLLTIKTISPSFFLWLIVFTFSLHAVGSSIRMYVNPIRMALCSSCMRSNIMYCLHTLLTLTTISPSFFLWLIVFTFSLRAVGASISVYVNPIRIALCLLYAQILCIAFTHSSQSKQFPFFLLVADRVHFLSPCCWFIY